MVNPFEGILCLTEKPTNFENYGSYVDLAKNGKITIYTENLNINNWDEHYNSILNIMKDSIETKFTQNMFITVIFADAVSVELTIMDYWFNLIFWYLPIRVNDAVVSSHIYFKETITKRSIKDYIDKVFIDKNRKKFSNQILNNIIDDAIHHFNSINNFSMFFANSINLEDNIKIMNADPEFYNDIHIDLSNIPIEDVKSVGMHHTNKAIKRMINAKDILGYDHCLANSFRASEGINAKQFKEFDINIGSKPDGQGGVFPVIINQSFITGGVNNLAYYLIESSSGRTAQIMMKINVGDSGHFARLLGLNNMDTILNKNPEYVCETKNFIMVTVVSDKFLSMIDNRFYRTNPNGIDKLIKYNKCKFLIGQTIYLRSPMTCASYAAGRGICYKCYGDLAYTNYDINIGRIASEELTAKLTQMMLSAKHLLETAIKALNWTKEFYNAFEVEANILKLRTDINFRGWKMIIDPEDIQLENEDDYDDDSNEDFAGSVVFNEYINQVTVESPEGTHMLIHSEEFEKLYISTELNAAIRNKAKAVDEKIVINMADVTECPVFYIIIQNNELSKTLDKLQNTIDKTSITNFMNVNSITQAIIETLIEGGLDVSAIHAEVILSNQIRDKDEILDNPDWTEKNVKYQILTLKQALANNPSITITLSYQNLAKILYNPLTYKKFKPSFMDLFFMKTPQDYLSSDNIIEHVNESDKERNIVVPGYFVSKDNEGDESND